VGKYPSIFAGENPGLRFQGQFHEIKHDFHRRTSKTIETKEISSTPTVPQQYFLQSSTSTAASFLNSAGDAAGPSG